MAVGGAQSPATLKIEAELSVVTEPARRLSLLNELAAALVDGAPEDAVRRAEEAAEIAERLGDQRGVADASLSLGRALLKLNRFDRAQAAADKALDVYRQLKLPDPEIEAAFTRANIAFNRGEYRESAQRHEALLKQIDIAAKPSPAASVLERLANARLMLGDFGQAFDAQSRALDLRRKMNDEQSVASALIALGSIEYARGKWDAASAIYMEALGDAERLGRQDLVLQATLYLGMAMFDRERLDDAERHLSRAIDMARRQKQPVFLTAALRGLSWVRQKQLRPDEAQALLDGAELNESANRQLAEIQTRLDSELRARQVERLERDREIQKLVLERQTLLRNAAIGGVVLVSALLVVAVNAFRLKRRAARQLAAKNADLMEANIVIASERARSERLLLSILPAAIASRLKLSSSAIADSYPAATVLFADIVGFTPLSRKIGASELVRLLDQMFSRFDALAARHGLEKIKTIGDCYMVVGGLPEPKEDHCERIAAMALDLLAEVRDFNAHENTEMSLRVGFHVGPVVAGVIGRQKFSYDLWGDTVNTASRLESTGAAGHIHVSEEVARALRGKFEFEPRGRTEVKGIGSLATYFLSQRAGGGASVMPARA
ncbi:adenylate/guanylate cyclase domain-containing protein [Terrarubrum flagellatum]|uniref:adenylate/guanylate cyclase domain-containing protein n=1 Tax=Terrirubrum flagellatum TaxID=2895980 RepID=UPI003144F9AD